MVGLKRNFTSLDETVTGGTTRMTSAFKQLGVGLGLFTAGAMAVGGGLALAGAAGTFEQGLAAVGAVNSITLQGTTTITIKAVGVIDRATDLDDAGLMAIAQCAQENVAQEAANVGKALASLGKLIGLINVFMSIVGGPEIPDLSDLAGRPGDQLIEPLDGIVETSKTARDAIPVP